jgi:hypothetical protein
MIAYACGSSYFRSRGRRIVRSAWVVSTANKLKVKNTEGMDQMVEHLLSKHKALSSICSTIKK